MTNLSAAQPRPARVAPPSTPGPSGLSTLAVAVVCVAALYLGREIFISLVLAVLLSFVLAPIVNFLRSWYIPRVPAIVITVLLALGIIAAVGVVMGFQIADLGTHVSEYQKTIEGKVAGLQTGVLGRFSALVHRANVAVHEDTSRPGNNAAPAANKDPSAPAEKALLVRLPAEEVSPLAVAQTVLAPMCRR